MLFHDAISKSKSPTFRSLYESKKTLVMGKAKVMEVDRNLFQRLFVAKSSWRTVDLAEILRHELFPVPLSLADTAGELHHTQKKVQVGKDQEKAQSEKDSHSKNRGGKKPN